MSGEASQNRDPKNAPSVPAAASAISTPPLAGDLEPHCPHCNYNLTALTSPYCPECGRTINWARVYSEEALREGTQPCGTRGGAPRVA